MNCWNQFPRNTQLFFSIIFQQRAERSSQLIQFSICITNREKVAEPMNGSLVCCQCECVLGLGFKTCVRGSKPSPVRKSEAHNELKSDSESPYPELLAAIPPTCLQDPS
uniref:Uncharacterized protein n=1 Tax=Mus musculus TaxID=10090 RepID=Q8C8W8_MOUSE|nr:unnamed protein product [Mus musculus]